MRDDGIKTLLNKGKKRTKSTQDLGRETLEEQKDTFFLDEIQKAQNEQERNLINQREK